MANRRFNRNLYTIGEREILIAGSFVPLTTTGTITASSVTGLGFGYAPNSAGTMALQTAARPGISGTPGIIYTSPGDYAITLDDCYLEVTSVTGSIGNKYGTNGAENLFFHVDDPPAATFSAGTATKITIHTVNSSGTHVDAPATNMRVHFAILLRDSTVTYGKP